MKEQKMLALLDCKIFQIDGAGVSMQEAILFLGICIVVAAMIRGICNK